LVGDSHQFKIEVRPYIEHDQFKAGDIIAQEGVNLMMVEQKIDEAQVAIQPIATTDKWQLSNDSYNKTLIKELNTKIAQSYFKNITSITVIKQGKLLIEEYFNGADRNTLHDMRSVGKTMASSIMGIAINDGHIKDDMQTLKDFYDLTAYQNHSKSKEQVTLKSLLTMSSGF